MTIPWTSETTWTVSRGSLHSVLTFDSFDFPIDSESTSPKQPLLLLPPSSSSDFQPCEIKLNFTQRHEIRQVYVRSTARIYEIYYAPALQDDNEYLCTVRCSAASVDGNSIPETDVKVEGAEYILPKARMAGENKTGANEDGWVEVKHPIGRVDEGVASFPNKNSIDRRNYQDFYEATAEINDSEPCMSLTIRLLSLQSKGCVYVDEVYVFADAVDANETENQTVNADTSAGSSLMTMLVPTLLGLTKSRSEQLHDQNSPGSVRKLIKTELEPIASTQPVNLVHQQDVTSRNPSEEKAELTRSHACDCTTRNELSGNRAEVLLEQLVARVGRIEDICMRFEESMLKPLNNMETRLECVEQQVELLGKCTVSPSVSRLKPDPSSINSDRSDSCEPVSQNTGSFSTETHQRFEDICMRFEESMLKPLNNMEARLECVGQQVELLGRCMVSPSFPRLEPDPSTISSDRTDSCEPILQKTGSFSSETHEPPGDASVATVQEVPTVEQEEMSDVLESPKKGNSKKTISIDDALAAALAGFSSFTKTESSTVESDEIECLSHNQASIEPTLGTDNGEVKALVSCEQVKETAPELIGEENDRPTEILDTRLHSCEEDAGPLSPTETDAQQESIKPVKTSTFDKTDILKYFPDQPPPDVSEPRVDFESSVLEVKFASFGNSSLGSSLEGLLTSSDEPATDERVLVEDTVETANGLLVDLGGDDVSKEAQQDNPPEACFESLI